MQGGILEPRSCGHGQRSSGGGSAGGLESALQWSPHACSGPCEEPGRCSPCSVAVVIIVRPPVLSGLASLQSRELVQPPQTQGRILPDLTVVPSLTWFDRQLLVLTSIPRGFSLKSAGTTPSAPSSALSPASVFFNSVPQLQTVAAQRVWALTMALLNLELEGAEGELLEAVGGVPSALGVLVGQGRHIREPPLSIESA